MDRNFLIDLLFSIIQDAADEWHTKEDISALETEISNIPLDCVELLKEKQEELAELLTDYVDGAILRREKTDILGAKSPHYDYHNRCHLKHRGAAFVMATEAYLADPCDELYEVMKKSEKRFWNTVKKFMGVKDIENCGRCLSDQLNRGNQKK